MNRHFVMLAPVSFNRLRQRHQSFAHELCRRGNRVTFIEPLKSGGFGLSRSHSDSGAEIIEIRVPWRCTAFAGLHSIAVELGWRILARRLQIKPEEAVLWVSEPSMAQFCRHNWQLVLYDRCDLHGQFPGQSQKAWKKYEEVLFNRCEVISITHLGLLNEIEPQHLNKTVLCKNACSDIFTRHRLSQRPKVPPVRFISSGAHYEWIDCDWLKQFAGRYDTELHIAGSGRGRSFEELVRLPGVTFHAELSHEQLSELMGRCHVGLLPFKDIALVSCVDPIKAYEYAAAGLQIWSTDIESMKNLELPVKTLSLLQDKDLVFEPICTSEKIAVWSDRINIILEKINQVTKTKQ